MGRWWNLTWQYEMWCWFQWSFRPKRSTHQRCKPTTKTESQIDGTISSVLCQLDVWLDAACSGCKFAWEELFRFPTIYSFHISKFQLNQQGSIMYFACFPISHTIRVHCKSGDNLWGKVELLNGWPMYSFYSQMKTAFYAIRWTTTSLEFSR